jgi:xanthine dehydrogenase accessory factor
MREIAQRLRRWRADATPFALATVVGVRGSAPRGPGAVMAVSAAGEVCGSVSGGCVDGDVYEVAREVLATGAAVARTYGISDADAFEVGLTCGGIVEIMVTRPPADVIDPLLASILAGEPVALATVVGDRARLPPGGQVVVWPDRVGGTFGAAPLDAAVAGDARGMLDRECAATHHYEPASVFVQSFAPAPRMLLFGAVDVAAAVAMIGSFLGYRVTVCDARPVFATTARFPGADEVVVARPDRYLATIPVDAGTVICVFTHDAALDVPILLAALRSPAGYVGAMGSRRTHADRLERLRAAGLTDAELARLHSPIGLDIGGCTPRETAVSIVAEIVQARRGGTGAPLGQRSGRIHPPP